MVMSYADAVLGHREIGKRAASRRGREWFDVTEFLTVDVNPHPEPQEMGTRMGRQRGSVIAPVSSPAPTMPATREVFFRNASRADKVKAWARRRAGVRRASVKMKAMEQISGRHLRPYRRRRPAPELPVTTTKRHRDKAVEVDNIVICAGRESVRDLVDPLTVAGVRTHIIGGADVAAELDAKRAIRQGTEVAAGIG